MTKKEKQEKAESKDIRKNYPHESAGRKMTFNVPKVQLSETIGHIESALIKNIKSYDDVDYIYVVDSHEKLKGVISIKELFRTPKDTKISKVIKRDLVSAHPYTDQERIAILALKNNIKTVPVVDKTGRFLGAVSSKTILKTMHTEAVEDALHYAGIQKTDGADITKISIIDSIKTRLPWLIIGLLGGIITAEIIGFFDNALQENLILTIFMPIVIYMADAVASQTQVLFIRNLTTNHHLILKQYLSREIKISLSVALICSIFFSLISIFWHKQITFAIILGISLFIAIGFAIGVAILIPWIINKLKKDPAVGSGPFATIITDILSLVVYFSVTTVLIELLT